MVQLHAFPPGGAFAAGPYAFQSVPVSHPVESCGFVISRDNVSIAVSGDTGPTEQLWKTLNATVGLRAVFLECSFPNRLQALADVSGHLTPHTLRMELEKLDRRGAEVFLYHLKPGYVPELKRELVGLPVTVLELGDTFEFRVDAA
jgi:ribonuclease BN (tRNA processing enzyme)